MAPAMPKAMVLAVFIGLFLPIPGSALGSVALIVAVAEVHRALAKRGGFPGATLRSPVMSIDCDLILQRNATPEQLQALGAALWRWCNRPAAGAGIYQSLDSQALADLIAGRLPPSSQTARQVERGVHLRVRDEPSRDRQATIDRLRREIPGTAVKDILVAGTSWNLAGSGGGGDQ
jgi:hypothetical protein